MLLANEQNLRFYFKVSVLKLQRMYLKMSQAWPIAASEDRPLKKPFRIISFPNPNFLF
jgi:hypothetical protein